MGFNDNKIVIVIPPPLKAQFKIKCDSKGISMSSRLRSHVWNDIDERVPFEDLPDPSPNEKEAQE
jgi:hypothetical protein